MVYSTDHSKAVVPVLVLLLPCGLFNEVIYFNFAWCYFVFCCVFELLSIGITSLGVER